MAKITVQNYSFSASANTIEFSDYVSIDLKSVLLITNVTNGNAIIYNFAGKPTVAIPTGLGGTVSGNILTLAYDTSAMSDSDELQIWYWDIDVDETIEVTNFPSEYPLPAAQVTALTPPAAITGFATQTTLASIDTKLTNPLPISGTVTANTGLAQPLTDTQLRASAVPISGTFWQVTQPVSGPLTDAQLRATAVPVSGTISTGLTQPLTDTQLRATAVPISGTFWQTTQPVSGPLTDAQLRASDVPVDTGLSQGLTDTELRAVPVPISGTVTANTGLTQPLTDTQLRATAVPVSGSFWQATQPVSGTITANAGTNLNTSLLALEAGGNLADIKAKTDNIPALGQALAAGSVPIVLTAAQLTTLTPVAAITGFATQATLALIKDTDGIKKITDSVTVIQGTASNLKVAATLDAETTKVIGTINIAAAQTLATVTTLGTITNVVHVDDNSGALTVDNAGTFAVQATLTAETTKVIGTINVAASQTIAVTNTGTFAVQSTPVTQADTFMLGGVNVKEINAVAPLMGSGIMGTGSLRVTIASDNDALTVKQGTATNLKAEVVGTGTFVTQSTLAAETTKVIGTVNIAGSQTIAVTNVTASNLNMTEASAANILTKLTAGVASMVKLEDVASNDADAGVPAMFVRKATPANTSNSDADYEFLQGNNGALWVSPLGFQVTVSTDVTRQAADTTTYAANDAISDSTSAPTSGGFTFTGVARKSGGSGIITDIIFSSSATPATLLAAELWIFDSTVTNINDNTAFAVSDSEIKTLVVVVPFTLADAGNNSIYHAQNLSIGFTTVGSANLRFLLRAKNAYIPVGSEVITTRLKIIQTD